MKIFDPIYVSEDDIKESEKRFFHEAKVLFSLNHKNIVKIYDIGRLDGKPFIRMELIKGLNMNQFVEKYSLVSFRRSIKPITALLEGLKHAHAKGVIHRDLKPSNYMVDMHGNFKIVDFGTSAFLENEGHTKLTKTGQQIAGGLYIDPYFAQNPRLRDVRSDIYSVGAIWYFLLTGKAPAGSDLKKVLLSSQDITELQANIILKCLSQDINKRYSNCSEILQILDPRDASETSLKQRESQNRITEVTRLDIIEYLNETFNDEMYNNYYSVPSQYSDDSLVFRYHGRLSEVDFLNRLYNLTEIPSNSEKYDTFEEEVSIMNEHGNPYWVFNDERLMLRYGDDETLLRFLCEMFHPVVRMEKSDWKNVLDDINNLLDPDGYEIYTESTISNRPVYSYRNKI